MNTEYSTSKKYQKRRIQKLKTIFYTISLKEVGYLMLHTYIPLVILGPMKRKNALVSSQ